MTAWHAIHPSPYDDACPDCAGYGEPSGSNTFGLLERWGDRYTRTLLVVLVALLAAVVLYRRSRDG